MKVSLNRFLLVLFILASTLWADRDQHLQPFRVMDSIGIRKGMRIGEAGAGEGYFTFKMVKRIGEEGIIYANDIVSSKLDKIAKRCKREVIQNIKTIKGEVDDPKFPEKNLDMIIMVYVFHDLKQPVRFLKKSAKYLKPNAPIVIVDRDPERYTRNASHFMKKSKILEKVKQAGFRIQKVMQFLPRDNIYIIIPDQ